MTASRCSSPKAGPAACTATGSTGRRRAQVECVIKDMPGYPDNINRASDGTYWMAWLGMRTPSFDLALRHPGMRKRMTRRLPQDEWLFPNINTGGVVKFDESGAHRRDPRRPDRREPSDGDLDARAQGLALCRRHPQQPHRPLPHPRRRSELDRRRRPIGERSHDLRPHPRPLPRQGGHHPADGRRVPAQHAARRGRRRARDRGAGQSLPSTARICSSPAATDVLSPGAGRRRRSASSSFDRDRHRAGGVAGAATSRSACDDGEHRHRRRQARRQAARRRRAWQSRLPDRARLRRRRRRSGRARLGASIAPPTGRST